MGKVEIPHPLNCGFLSDIPELFFLNQYGTPQLQLNGREDDNLSIDTG